MGPLDVSFLQPCMLRIHEAAVTRSLVRDGNRLLIGGQAYDLNSFQPRPGGGCR